MVITLAAYGPVRRAGFVWDDDAMLLNNPLMRQAGGWYQAWLNRAADDFVPATMTSLWLEWRLWGSIPLGYHIDNVMLHLASAFFIWRILLRLKVPGAWLAAAIFAVHPVNSESVAWITQRKNTLTLLLFLVAIRFYLTFEDTGRWRWLRLSEGMFLLALLGKTAVVPLPVVLLGLAWWQRGRIAVKDLKNCLVFVVLAAAGSLMAVVIQHGAAAGLQVRPDNIWVRLAGAGWALWFYLWKALVPLNLNFVYPRWDIQAQNPLSYLPLALWVGGLWICWRFRRTWGRGVVFAMGYFTVMLLPVLGLVSIYFMRYSLVADHWQYFAIIGPIALLAAGIKTRLAAVNWASPFLPPSFCAVVLLTFGALTWRQCGIYGGVETLWRATLAQNPGSFLANNNLGTLLRQSGRVDEAITHYQAALLVEPDDESIHFNLAKAYFQRGMFDQAILQFQRALQIAPADMEAENNLAWLLATSPQASLRDGAKAVQLARRANDLAGGKNPVVLGTLAAALAETGNFGDAVAVSQKAVSAAEAEGRRDLTGPLNAQLLRYKAGLPWHQ